MKYIIDIPNEMAEATARYWNETTNMTLVPYAELDCNVIEDEVWEFVREFSCLGNLALKEISGNDDITDPWAYIEQYSYQEAKAKYETWLKQKDEIKVGDEVEYPPNKAKGIVVQCHVPDVYAEVDKYAVFTGTSVEYLPIECLTKTGRVFPEVAELLEKMRGKYD